MDGAQACPRCGFVTQIIPGSSCPQCGAVFGGWQQQAWTPAPGGDVGAQQVDYGQHVIPDRGTEWWGIGTALATVCLIGIGLWFGSWHLTLIGVAFFFIVYAVAGIGVLIAAFQESVTHGVLSLFVPFYVLYFATTSAVGKTLKWLFWTNLGAGVLVWFGLAIAVPLAFLGVNAECRNVRKHQQPLEEVMTAFSTRAKDATSDPSQMSRVWTQYSKQLRDRIQQFGEMSFDDRALESEMVQYFELLVRLPERMDDVGRAFATGNQELVAERLKDFRGLIARISTKEADIDRFCGIPKKTP